MHGNRFIMNSIKIELLPKNITCSVCFCSSRYLFNQVGWGRKIYYLSMYLSLFRSIYLSIYHSRFISIYLSIYHSRFISIYLSMFSCIPSFLLNFSFPGSFFFFKIFYFYLFLFSYLFSLVLFNLNFNFFFFFFFCSQHFSYFFTHFFLPFFSFTSSLRFFFL